MKYFRRTSGLYAPPHAFISREISACCSFTGTGVMIASPARYHSYSRRTRESEELETCDFGEVKIPNGHGGNDHVAGLLSRGPDGRTERYNIREHLQQSLVEPQIPNAAADPAALDPERPVARHAGENLLVRID